MVTVDFLDRVFMVLLLMMLLMFVVDDVFVIVVFIVDFAFAVGPTLIL